MMTKIGGGSGGSCGGLVDYLEKEQAGLWFDQQRALLAGHQVVAEIDHNKRNLGRDDAKYYQVILAPSQAELAHIGSDPDKLQAFTRAAMEQYAANFGKGISSQDLVWFAKIEHSRHFDHTDRAVQLGEQPGGVAKDGDQTHIHVIVSRTEHLRHYTQGKKNGQYQRKNPYHLSPLTNHKATTKGPVVGGFERNGFSQRTEQTFDQAFGYDRRLTDSFRFLHCMKYGDEVAKSLMQQAAAADREIRQQRAQSPQSQPDQPPARQVERDALDALRTGLGQAYQQQDVATLTAALARAQAECDRQQAAAEQQAAAVRKQALEAAKSVQPEPVVQSPTVDQPPKNAPRISRGL